MAKWKFATSSDTKPGAVPAGAAPDCALAATPPDAIRRPYRTVGNRAAVRMLNSKGWRVTFLGI
jgi:hypothetical protein